MIADPNPEQVPVTRCWTELKLTATDPEDEIVVPEFVIPAPRVTEVTKVVQVGTPVAEIDVIAICCWKKK